MIHVIAIITTTPGQREAVLTAFRENMPAVHAEAGCIEYAPVVDAGLPGLDPLGPDSFIVVEKWESAAALRAHAGSPHMQAYGARVREMLAGRVVHALQDAA